MTNQLSIIRDFLARLIEETQLRETGRHSLTEFAARVRRETAQEILAFVQSLSEPTTTRSPTATTRETHVPGPHVDASARTGSAQPAAPL
jgi:hypothetical protein